MNPYRTALTALPVRSIRMLGSAAIMLAWVAAGRLTAYYEADLHSWDTAAGRGLYSFRFQVNLKCSVHRVTQLKSRMCPGVAQVELQCERV
jgi:hypothetical protein